MARDRSPRPAYEGAPVGELGDPLLPRWFVLLLVALVPVAIGVALASFLVFGPEEVPVEARRPVPAEGSPYTTEVGQLNVGDLPADPIPADCPVAEGLRAGGTAGDQSRIAAAVNVLCDIPVPGDAAARLRAFAEQGGIIRFAQFEITGVDSALDLQAEPLRVLINARWARGGTDARSILPLLMHDVTYVGGGVGTAEAALSARQVEAAICELVFTEAQPPRACDDADQLLDLTDPLAALRAVGYR